MENGKERCVAIVIVDAGLTRVFFSDDSRDISSVTSKYILCSYIQPYKNWVPLTVPGLYLKAAPLKMAT